MPSSSIDARRPEFLVRVNDRFGIGFRSKPVTQTDQAIPQRVVVVDLAVERDPTRAVLVGERLFAAGAIDDCQTAMAERHEVVAKEAVTVRATVSQRLRHRRKDIPNLGVEPSADGRETCNSTHCQRLPNES